MLFCRLSGLLLFSLVAEAICMVTRSVSTVSNNEMAVFLKKVLIPCIGNARQYTPGSCDSGKDVEHAYIWLTPRELQQRKGWPCNDPYPGFNKNCLWNLQSSQYQLLLVTGEQARVLVSRGASFSSPREIWMPRKLSTRNVRPPAWL